MSQYLSVKANTPYDCKSQATHGEVRLCGLIRDNSQSPEGDFAKVARDF
jgi:hypothetical protein